VLLETTLLHSILQIELSLAQVLDRAVTGRIFFEEVNRENLDLGRPQQVQLICFGPASSPMGWYLRSTSTTKEPASSNITRKGEP